jgi:hypothetical protein
MKLNALWAGQLYGTNTGKLFLELQPDGEHYAGTLRLADDVFGLSVFNVVVQQSNDFITLQGSPARETEEVEVTNFTAVAKLKSNGQLTGEWKTANETAGTFELFPHVGVRLPTRDVGPEQLYTASRDLGALRLSKADLVSLLNTVQRKFPESKIVVTHIERGAELARYAQDFLASIDDFSELRWIKINGQAAVTDRFARIITIDLGPNFNRVSTQGPDESWVLGEAEATASFLKSFESRLSTAIGKHHVNFNLLIFLGALIAMPDLSLEKRTIFAISVLVFIIIAQKLQSNLIPNLVISATEKPKGKFLQFWPSILSWLISMTAAVAASVAYKYLLDLKILMP